MTAPEQQGQREGTLPEADPTRPGTLLLFDLPLPEMRVDLATLKVDDEFRGFSIVPTGLHYVAASWQGRYPSRWVHLGPGQVKGLRFDAEEGAFAELLPEEVAELGGRYDPVLRAYPVLFAPEWRRLTVGLLDPRRFPPPVALADPPGGSALEAAWLGTHAGEGAGLEAELSWSFLRGVLEDDDALWSRYLHLVGALYGCDEGLARRDPQLLSRLIRLLVVQLAQLPEEFLEEGAAPVAGAEALAAVLEASGVPSLGSAGRRLRGFLESHRRHLHP